MSEHDHECECGHDPNEPHECCGKHDHGHNHAHGDECDCGHDHHDHEHGEHCGCGHDHDHDHHHHHHDEAHAALPLQGIIDGFADAAIPNSVEFACEYNGVTLHAQRWGNPDDMPVVLLHGFMQSGDSWGFVAPELSEDHCVWALDFVGHGGSSAPDDAGAFTYDAAVDAVEAFLRDVVCAQSEGAPADARPRKAHVLGYSMGGRVALALGTRKSPYVYSLILESCGAGPVSEEERAQAQERNAEWARRLREEGMEAFVGYWEELPLFASQKERGLHEKQRAARLANDAEAMAKCVEGMGKHQMPLAQDTISALACTWLPIKYIWGTQDAAAGEVAHAFDDEGFDVSAVECGHNVHLEAPMLYLRIVKDFMSGNELKGLM